MAGVKKTVKVLDKYYNDDEILEIIMGLFLIL